MKKLGKLAASLLIALVALWPFWIAVGVWRLLEPSDFWEKLALALASLLVAGAPQFWMGVISFGFIMVLWSKD